jgi:hypothetical protein
MHFSKRHLLKTAQFFCIAVILLSSCSDEPGRNDVVYVGGQKDGKATYWENGRAVTVGSDGASSRILAIYYSGGVLHSAGSLLKPNDGNVNAVARYWRNSEEFELTVAQSTTLSSANSIYVVGEDVYIAGNEVSNDIGRAVYWKNGSITYLTDGKIDSYANAIFVFENNVYIAGGSLSGEESIAKYWKNGIEIILGKGGYSSSMYVIDNDVYVAGERFNSFDKEWYSTFWKNGNATDLLKLGFASSIFVSGNDVYIADRYASVKALYWKNGIANDLTDVAEYKWANGLFVLNGDVYVAGFENGFAKYWKNGTSYRLNEEKNNKSEAVSIFVKR